MGEENRRIIEYLAENGIYEAAELPFDACSVLLPRLLPFEPQCAIVFAVPYYVGGEDAERNLSRYAVSRDYHLFMRLLFDALKQAFPEYEGKIAPFADHSPIAEVDAALQAGLGCRGQNGLLLHPRYGSYLFLGEVLTLFPTEARPKAITHCIDCGKCRRACPSPDDCLSDITQRKGELTDAQKQLMLTHHTCWGCDICQEVCPYNRNLPDTPIPFFHTQRIPHLTLERLDAMDKATFRSYAFAWRGRSVIRRNLLLFENPPKKESST